MNRQIIKLFGFLLILYALLFGFTSYWSVFDASSLKANQANRRPLLEEQRIKRGAILASDGTVIARSVAQGTGNNKVYVRRYPEGGLFGNPIGYSFVTQGRVGFELSHNDELVGNKTEFLSVLDQLQGHSQVGQKVQAALDSAAQEAAVNGLAGRRGSVVALDPSTGEVRAMVSIPEYDPNQIPKHFAQLNR
ncbi:MAG TPA: penicillin-binding protein 2, partial [Thermoanaerobaculia bacterium]